MPSCTLLFTLAPPETIRVDMRKALNILKDLKLVVKTKTKRVTHSGILIYPANPSELAADFLKEAYAELLTWP